MIPVPVALCVLLAGTLSLVEGDVVANFEDIPECVEYFYQGKVPGWGVATPGAARLCQRFYNRYHFATLYDTNHRIAVYSAYSFQPSNGGGREKRWFVEPQLVNLTWGTEMKAGYWLGKDHPGVYLGERQALNEDYTHSGFDRGHLNPNAHHAVPSHLHPDQRGAPEPQAQPERLGPPRVPAHQPVQGPVFPSLRAGWRHPLHRQLDCQGQRPTCQHPRVHLERLLLCGQQR
ncbi:endonuclease domain-containing 1 protein-like isoform X1 [Coregonus clupeaformis]|uniref:endonuclease domain-containing 1 protein-like isoform X1 n=1 Tax=Coregonus clupeaformis TaxID=59861 RepID=UPI001BDFF2D4|nr:endonuclease domain-containing 1 protein-like isoform X1 [Coregonus clupeaformis]